MPTSNSTQNLVKISETTTEIWWFSFFLDGGRPTSWIFIQVKNGRYGTLLTVHVCHYGKFGENSSNGSLVIAIFHYSKWLPAAILDFAVAPKWRHRTLWTVHSYRYTKFGEDISKSVWDMAIFLFSRWRPAAILDFDTGQKWRYGTLPTVHV